MLAPERRTRADLLIAVAIAIVVVVAAGVAWAHSDSVGTESVTAANKVSTPAAAEQVPTSLRELWHQPDRASARALVSGGVVVTADDGTVTGRDPATGEQVWRYRRDMPLCGVEAQFSMVIATYRDQRGCSQTSMLEADNGARRTARSSYMDKSVRLSVDGTYVLAQGPRRLEMWRSDLVRTLEYGYVDAPNNVKTQPRSGCTFLSAASSSSRLGVLERCPGDPGERLTMLNPAPKENTEPEEYGSRALSGPGANSPDSRVIAVSDNRIVLYFPAETDPETTSARLAVYDATGNPIVAHELSAPLGKDTTTARIGSAYLVFTGNSVIALNASTFDPMWTAPDALGTPVLMAGRLLVPVPGAIAVLEPSSGAEVDRIPVDRTTDDSAPTATPYSLAVVGTTVLERRGGQLYALG
ncbi:Rv3212 family protein [Nocardia callitridis]|uniref:Pyrrolo-quinoline quinone repeat domain-containing protein n=1 Tax=Nocardia callitridis TaxID=648753 RepID=A0ABP9JSQ0_9NOCA